MAVRFSGNIVGRMNEVRRAGLALTRVTVRGYTVK